jgi:hypothetical protein
MIPSILLHSPQNESTVCPPVCIDLEFVQGEAPLDYSTLCVEYCKYWFPIDITEKVRPYLVGNRITYTATELPSGEHCFQVTISDTANNTAIQQFTVTING